MINNCLKMSQFCRGQFALVWRVLLNSNCEGDPSPPHVFYVYGWVLWDWEGTKSLIKNICPWHCNHYCMTFHSTRLYRIAGSIYCGYFDCVIGYWLSLNVSNCYVTVKTSWLIVTCTIVCKQLLSCFVVRSCYNGLVVIAAVLSWRAFL